MLCPFRAAAICLKVRMNGSPKSFSLLKRLIRVLKYAFCTVSQNGFSGKGRKGMFSFGRGGKPALRNRAKRRYSIRSADRSATGYRPDRSAAKRSRRRGIGKTRSRPKRCRSVRVRCRARGPSRSAGSCRWRPSAGKAWTPGTRTEVRTAGRRAQNAGTDQAPQACRQRVASPAEPPASQLPTMMPAALVAKQTLYPIGLRP